MGIRIEAGCTQSLSTGKWTYIYEDTDGIHMIEFTAAQRPVIGDTIENGVLVPKTGYIINNDPGFQKKGTLQPRTWPIEGRDS